MIPASELTREAMGKAVREAYVHRTKLKVMSFTMEANQAERMLARANQSWDEMSEFDRETDRCIGDAVLASLAGTSALPAADLTAWAQAAEQATSGDWSADAETRCAALITIAHSIVPQLLAEIARQGAEVGRLMAELDAAYQSHHTACHEAAELKASASLLAEQHDELLETCGRLRAQRDELRRALEWYVENDETNEGDGENSYFVAGKEAARAALARSDP